MIIYSNLNPLWTKEMCRRRRAYDMIFFPSFFTVLLMFIYDSLNHNRRAFDDIDDDVTIDHYPHLEIKTSQKILQAPNFHKMWHLLGVRRQATAKRNAETGEMSCKRRNSKSLHKMCQKVGSLVVAFLLI